MSPINNYCTYVDDMETNELRLFSRYYEEFGIDKKIGDLLGGK